MQKHSRMTPEGRAFWYTEELWKAASGLEIKMVGIDSIVEFDQNCWFVKPPTCRQVAEHARQIMQADLDFPIILSSDGQLMDGGQRIAKAYLLGLRDVKARQFEQDPEPDWLERLSSPEL